MSASTHGRIGFLAALMSSFFAIEVDSADASATYNFTGSTPDPIDNVLSPLSPQIPVTASITYSPTLPLISTFPFDPVSPIGGAYYDGTGVSITLNIGGNSITASNPSVFTVSGGSVEMVFGLSSGGSIEFAASPITPTQSNYLPPTLDATQFSTAWINYVGEYAYYNGVAFIPLDTPQSPSQPSQPTPTPEPSALELLAVVITALGIRSACGRRKQLDATV